MAPPQYQTPPQPPPVFTATADSILADSKNMSETTKRIYDKVVGDVQPDKGTFANVFDPMLADENETAASKRILTFYHQVSPDASLREASNKAEEMMNDFHIETRMREDIFKLVDAVYARRESLDLEAESLQLLTKERQKYVRNGLLLPAGPQRDRFKEIQKRLSQLCIQSQKNLNEESGGIWYFPKELEGVPKDDIDVDQLEKGTGENEGKVKLTFKYNHFFPLMKYARHEETRRKYTLAEANKVSPSGQQRRRNAETSR